MSSYRPSTVLTSETLPCAECGNTQMVHVVETVRLGDGLTVKKLAHYKCRSCGSRFFDDDAMHSIQTALASQGSSARAC
jgi:YgiT-type zinc finger domain-containing protein